MSDSAVGSISGYLFQFERALFLLCNLEEKGQSISIEKIDDIAAHSEEGSILLLEQDKHSILESGSTFKDTEYALWRTIQLWIQKLQAGQITMTTKLYCSTNKKISDTSLIKFIVENDFEKVKKKIQDLRNSQQLKLNGYKAKNGKKGSSISQILTLIDFALRHELECRRHVCGPTTCRKP